MHLNLKPKTIKLVGENLCNLVLGKKFLDMTPKAWLMKINDKLDAKIKNLCSAKYTNELMKK